MDELGQTTDPPRRAGGAPVGLAVPFAGLMLAAATGRRAAAALMAVALGLSVAGGVVIGILP